MFLKAPFNLAEFKVAMSRSTTEAHKPTYTCAGVLQWVNQLWSPTPGVRITPSSIDDVVSHNYKDGPSQCMPQPVVVAVTETTATSWT